MRTALLAAALALASIAQASPHTLAVAYFDNNSGDAQYDPLRKGLADMLITDLFNLSSLKVVEREKLNAVLDELKLGQTKLVDKTTAVKMGKLLSAEYVLTGALVVSKQTMRLDARVFKVEDGGMVATQHVEGPTDDFFSVEKDLVDALVKDLSLKVAPEERSKLRRNQTQSFAAFATYSRALDAQDLGNVEEAAKLFQAALDADPGYASAKTHLERMAALTKVARTQQAGRVDSELAALDPRSKDFGKRVFDLLVVPGSDERGVAQTIALFKYLAERDLKPVYGEGMGAIYPESNALAAFVMNYAWDPEVVELAPPVFEYLLRKYPQDRLLTSSNHARSPAVLQRQIEMKRRDPAFMQKQYESMEYLAPYRANRKAAAELFRIIAAKVPAK